MAAVRLQCTSCGAQFGMGAGLMGQVIQCPNCNQRLATPAPTTVQSGLSPPATTTFFASLTQRASQSFQRLPLIAQLTLVGCFSLMLGVLVGGWFTAISHYSTEAYKQQVARADEAEANLTKAEADQKAAERQTSVVKFELDRLKKQLSRWQATNGISDWISPDKWAQANAEIDNLTQQNESLKTDLMNAAARLTLEEGRAERRQREAAKPWYTGSAMHNTTATMGDWRRASHANKLATAANFVVDLLKKEGAPDPDLDSPEFRRAAESVVQTLDSDTCSDNFTIAFAVAAGWVMMKAESNN